MRIAYIADQILPSAAAHSMQILQMVGAMEAAGHEVVLVAPAHPARARSASELERIRYDYALPRAPTFRHAPLLDVGGRLRGSYHATSLLVALAGGFDVVYTRTLRVAAAAARLRFPVIVESHGLPNSMRGWRAANAVASSAHLLRWVFISEELRRRFATDVALPDDRIVVAHDGVDMERFEPMVDPGPARLAVPGIVALGDRPLVVHCGHLYSGRGGELLVDIAAAMPDVGFLLVGGRADDVQRVRRLATTRGAENVVLVGHLPPRALPPVLFAADVLVMPYTSSAVSSDGVTKTIAYASPMKLFEYMAATRPIVAARFPGIAEVLRNGENAVLVDPDVAEGFTRAIEALLADPGRRARLARRARHDVEQYSWRARVERVLGPIAHPSRSSW